MHDNIWQQVQFEAELLNNVTLVCHVIQSFLNDVPKALAAIDSAFAHNNSNELAKAAHYLHGSAAQLQLTALAQLCKTLQQDALQNIINASCVEQIRSCIAVTQLRLNDYVRVKHPHVQ
jgi:HPt (histidine-containing phosphotransfer) domain-containing protein